LTYNVVEGAMYSVILFQHFKHLSKPAKLNIWHNQTYDTIKIMTLSNIWHNQTYDTIKHMTQSNIWHYKNYDTIKHMTQSNIWHNQTY